MALMHGTTRTSCTRTGRDLTSPPIFLDTATPSTLEVIIVFLLFLYFLIIIMIIITHTLKK